jgi:pimeloyl-ACP methyl ester carboxylesterase
LALVLSRWSARALGVVAATLLSSADAHDFAPCADADSAPLLQGSQCATHAVPLNYSSGAQGEQLRLFMRKFPSTNPSSNAAELWLLSGGPGESGATLYPFIARLRASFGDVDVIVPDHRGSGLSSRLCPKEEAVDSPGGMALAGAERGSCFASLTATAARTRQFSISNAARDLRSLLAARGGSPRTYLYAVAYGTQLALRALQMGALPLQGVVLDSLVPQEGDAAWDLSRRSVVADDIGRQVLARCDANAVCRDQLGDSAALSYQRVLDRFEQADLPKSLLGDLPGQDLKTFLGSLLDWPATRELIPSIIQDLEAGNDAALKAALATQQALAATWPALPQMSASTPLAAVISGSENNLRPEQTRGAVRQSHRGLLFTSPLPELLAEPAVPLYAPDKFFGQQPSAKPGMPPLLIFSGTLDAKTAWAGASQHVAALRASGLGLSWVTVESAPHFILWTAADCFQTQVQAFLAQLNRPGKSDLPAQLRCVSSP